MTSIAIELTVNDKGSVVVKNFSDKTVSKVKQMSERSARYVQRLAGKFRAKLGGAVRSVGTALMSLKTLAAGALAGWGLAKILGKFATFESALADMGKVTSESFGSIKKKIMKLPSSLGSATELVRGYYQVISAGVKGAANQIDTLTTASKLAKTAHADQAQVITGLSSVMDAFKVKSMESADALQTMEKTGKTTVGGLIPVIGELSSSSAALGLDLNEMGAAFAAVTLQSGGTEKAATQFKALITSLIAPTGGMSKLLLKYGGAQQAIKKIGFGGVLKLIADATRGNAAETKKLLGSVEGYMGFLSASANDMQTYNDNLEEQKNKTGAVDRAWKNYQKTLNAIWDTFKNTIGKQVIWIGEKLAPSIKAVFSVTSDWLEKNRELIAVNIGPWAARAGQIIIDTTVLIIGAVALIPQAFYGVVEAGSIVNTALAATGAAAVDVAAVLAAVMNPLDALKVAANGYRDTFPALAKMRDFFDDLGNASAEGALKAEESRLKFTGWEQTVKDLGSRLSEMAGKSQAAADKQSQSSEKAAQKTETVWKETIIKLDGVWTNIREKVQVPLKISADDQAIPVLKRIQAEMAKIKSKTVYVKVVHTGTGSTERPLTDKINEIVGLYGTLPTQMTMNADFTQVTAGLVSIMEISNRLGSVESQYSFAKQQANRFGLIYRDPASVREISRLTALYEIGVSSANVPAAAGNTGGASISVGELNINVPNAVPQTAEDWRQIVREHIIPELERVGHA